jgi:hypothetical protein
MTLLAEKLNSTYKHPKIKKGRTLGATPKRLAPTSCFRMADAGNMPRIPAWTDC